MTKSEIVQQSTETLESVAHDDDDNDGLDAEIVHSQTLTPESFGKADVLVASLQSAVSELSEEFDYATVAGSVDGIIDILEDVVASTQNSQDDEIVIEQSESQDNDNDDMSHPPDDEDEEAEEIDEDDEEYNGEDL